MLLEKFHDQRRDRLRKEVSVGMNERLNGRCFRRGIQGAIRPARFTLLRAAVEFADLVDGRLLFFKLGQPVAFAAVMKNRPWL